MNKKDFNANQMLFKVVQHAQTLMHHSTGISRRELLMYEVKDAIAHHDAATARKRTLKRQGLAQVREVTLGQRTPKQMKQLLKHKEIITDSWVDSVLVKLPVLSSEETLQTVCIEGEQLGIRWGASYALCMLSALLYFGFESCPGEVAISYILHYGSTLEEGHYFFGMQPIKDDNDKDCIFTIRVKGGCAQLNLYELEKGHSDDIKWIFILPKEDNVDETA
jgi:hypothetical protein